eukprot:scaffold628_cov401-Prasinococcus_capsulatus_cf.AAC.6
MRVQESLCLLHAEVVGSVPMLCGCRGDAAPSVRTTYRSQIGEDSYEAFEERYDNISEATRHLILAHNPMGRQRLRSYEPLRSCALRLQQSPG